MNVTLKLAPVATHDPNLPLPSHETDGSAGMDLRACLPLEQRAAGLILPSLGRAMIPTGLSIAIPAGYEGQVRPRSGLAARKGVTVLNSPGTIDSDYRGEVKVLLINLGAENHLIHHGDRIAQIVVAQHSHVELEVVAHLGETDRGVGGFGSTGTQ